LISPEKTIESGAKISTENKTTAAAVKDTAAKIAFFF